MTEVITKNNVFNQEPDFELPEVAEDQLGDWIDTADIEHIAMAVGFSAKLWEVLTDVQKEMLSPYQRAALEKFYDMASDTAICDEVAPKIG